MWMETDLQNLQQNHSNTQKHHKLSWKLVRHEILLASTSMAPPMALQSPTPSYLDYKFVGPSRNNVYILKKKDTAGHFYHTKYAYFKGWISDASLALCALKSIYCCLLKNISEK